MSPDERHHVCAIRSYGADRPTALDNDLGKGPEYIIMCFFEPGGV
jgi:hypothetical protein